MDKLYFKNKYRVSSTRHPAWNYATDGYYFVTICIDNKKICLGKVKDAAVHLSPLGKIVKKYWLEIPKHNKNTKLDKYIVMPNHLHGIIIITNNTLEAGINYKRNFGPLPKNSLSTIINQFKRVVKLYCNKNKMILSWQSRFYDRIIMDDKELNNIRQYIIDNPLKWDLDENNPKNFKL